jgi:hypothetical protein
VAARGIRRREERNMSISMAPLLMHSEQVPAAVRDAIRRAYEAPPEHRGARFASAARILYQETDLECGDILELVGLPAEGNCA